MALHQRRLFMSAVLLMATWSGLALSAESGAVRQVTTQPLAEVVIYPRSSAPAVVLSLNESRISPEIDALVKTIAVRVGDRVNKGDSLLSLVCDDFRLQLNQTQAATDAAQARLEWLAAQLKRSESLRSSDSLSEELLQQRRSDLKVAEAERAVATTNVSIAKLNTERCSVTAPFAGVVVARLVSEGEWVSAGTPVVTLLDTQRLELSAQVGVDETQALRQAKMTEFVTQGERYPLTLRAMPEKIDSRLRQREARLSFTASTPLPGQVGRLEWQNGTAHLPADLPVKRAGRLGVFVVEQDKARFIILPDALEGRSASAASLPANALVVMEGRHSLREGDQVKVAD